LLAELCSNTDEAQLEELKEEKKGDGKSNKK